MRTAFLPRLIPFTVLVLLISSYGTAAGDNADSTVSMPASDVDVEPMVMVAFGNSECTIRCPYDRNFHASTGLVRKPIHPRSPILNPYRTLHRVPGTGTSE